MQEQVGDRALAGGTVLPAHLKVPGCQGAARGAGYVAMPSRVPSSPGSQGNPGHLRPQSPGSNAFVAGQVSRTRLIGVKGAGGAAVAMAGRAPPPAEPGGPGTTTAQPPGAGRDRAAVAGVPLGTPEQAQQLDRDRHDQGPVRSWPRRRRSGGSGSAWPGGFWLRIAAASDTAARPAARRRPRSSGPWPPVSALASRAMARRSSSGRSTSLSSTERTSTPQVVGDPGDDPVQLPVDRLAVAEHRVQVVLAEDALQGQAGRPG